MGSRSRVITSRALGKNNAIKMSSKDRSCSVSPGTVLSVFCLLLYSAGFIRNELKFGDYDQRLMAVEEVIPKLKEDTGEMVKASITEGRMSPR